MSKILLVSILSLLLICPVFAITVTVSTVGGPGMFNSIQYAITSCLTNPDSPDVVNILDNGPYFEALDIGLSGFDLTIQGSGGSRPVIVASSTNANAGPFGAGNYAIHLLVDASTTVIKDIVLIPDTTAPAGAGIYVNPNSTLSQYTVALINMVITGNDGNNQPITMDGRNLVSAATTFTLQGIDVRSASNPGHLYLEKVIVSKPTYYVDGNAGIRVLLDGTASDRASVNFGPGCVFSYLPQDGIYFGTSNYCDASLSGTSAEPIIITNNARWGIWDYNNTGNAAIKKLDWVIVTNNGSMGYRISGTSNQPTVNMTNCTFANNALSASTAQLDFSITAATNIIANNVIIAGNGRTTTARSNVVILGGQPLTISTSAIVLTGVYSLNTMASDTATGIIGTVISTAITNRNPYFWSLDPSNAGFAKLGNAFYATAGPNGGPLTGGGQFELNTGIVSVSPAEVSMQVSGTRTFFASGGILPYTWTSNSTAIGTIDINSGMFTALSLGTTMISATDVDGNAGTATVAVVATNAPIIANEQMVIIHKTLPFGKLYE